MKGVQAVYTINGVTYSGEILDVLHVPVMSETPGSLLTAGAKPVPSMAVASYVWVPVLRDKGGRMSTPTMLPLSAISVCGTCHVIGKGIGGQLA